MIDSGSGLLQGLDRLLPAYARADLTIVRGDGARVWDSDGREYLDFGAGIAVVALGHCHPARSPRPRSSSGSGAPPASTARSRLRLASQLSAFGSARRSATPVPESIEAAIKYAQGDGKSGVVALEGSFHGRTLGALGVTGQPTKRAARAARHGRELCGPNDIEALAERSRRDRTDPARAILGEGGVIPLDRDFVEAAAELPPLLCFDEIQTGVGRTGSFFAFEQLGVRPDLATLAKGLANGLPIGVLLVSDEVAGAFSPGDHGSTFGGNPISCAAACAVLDVTTTRCSPTFRRAVQLIEGLEALAGIRDAGVADFHRSDRRPGRRDRRRLSRIEGLLS
jgi:acetylornithine/succinyldiaminopimelate/putrescine aminotransferase